MPGVQWARCRGHYYLHSIRCTGLYPRGCARVPRPFSQQLLGELGLKVPPISQIPEMEAQRVRVTWPRSHSVAVAEGVCRQSRRDMAFPAFCVLCALQKVQRKMSRLRLRVEGDPERPLPEQAFPSQGPQPG